MAIAIVIAIAIAIGIGIGNSTGTDNNYNHIEEGLKATGTRITTTTARSIQCTKKCASTKILRLS